MCDKPFFQIWRNVYIKNKIIHHIQKEKEKDNKIKRKQLLSQIRKIEETSFEKNEDQGYIHQIEQQNIFFFISCFLGDSDYLIDNSTKGTIVSSIYKKSGKFYQYVKPKENISLVSFFVDQTIDATNTIVVTYTFSKLSNYQLKQQNAQLKQENAQLQQENTQLKQENAQLKQENAQLQQEAATHLQEHIEFVKKMELDKDNLEYSLYQN